MDATDATEHDASLLDEYAPVLKYDSQEAFFANHVRAMTDAPAWCLARSTEVQGRSMHIIASHAPGPHPLNLEFLALDSQRHYPNGDAFADGDDVSLALIGPDRHGPQRRLPRAGTPDPGRVPTACSAAPCAATTAFG